MDLNELRSEIDRIDEEIIKLFSERAKIALLTGEEKRKDGLPLYDEEREKIVLDRIASLNCGPLSDDTIREVYELLINACTELQKSAE